MFSSSIEFKGSYNSITLTNHLFLIDMKKIINITQLQKENARKFYDLKLFITSEFEEVNNSEMIEVVEEMIKKNANKFFTVFGKDESIISMGEKLNSGIFDENYMLEADVYLINHNKKWFRVMTGQAYENVEAGDSEDDDNFEDCGCDYSIIIEELIKENPESIAKLFIEDYGSDTEIAEWNSQLI